MQANLAKTNPGRARLMPADLTTCLGNRALLRLCLEASQLADPKLMAEARAHQPNERAEMLMTLLTYCYSASIYGSRDIEQAIRTDPTVRYICAGRRPDWQTLRRFRRQNRELIHSSLLHVLKQTWAFHFETGEADYVGCDWFESDLVKELTQTATVRLEVAALLDGADAD
jgi:hypothetical protein